MNNKILEQLSNNLYQLGREIGFSDLTVRSERNISEIYIINSHALQLEIDWRENNLFMYVVYIRNKVLPDTNVIYNYDDGHWCRKYIEEIYKTKRPITKDKKKRYSQEYLFELFEYYKQLINNNPSVLVNFYSSIVDSTEDET